MAQNNPDQPRDPEVVEVLHESGFPLNEQGGVNLKNALLIVVENYRPILGTCYQVKGFWGPVPTCIGFLYYDRQVASPGRRFFITKESHELITSGGYRVEDPTTQYGIVFKFPQPFIWPLALMDRAERKFLSGRVLVSISNALFRGTPETYQTVHSALVREGFTEEEASNQIRFSFTLQFEQFEKSYSDAGEGRVKIIGGTEGIIALTRGCEATRQRGVAGSQLLFNNYEEAQLAVIFAVHMNAKEFNNDNYDESVKKIITAYYNQCGLQYTDQAKLFLQTIFGKETIKTYHDYIPKYLRKTMFISIKSEEPTPLKYYIVRTLMKFNGMSLIEETFKLILDGRARRFLILERYIPEIVVFMTWFNSEKYHENFHYYWYTNPEKLDAVSEAKCANLYSVVLKHLKITGKMGKYKSGILFPDNIPAEDLVIVPNLI